MRRFAWTLIALLATSPTAFADCESDVREALSRLRTSGPFHYVLQEWNRNFVRQTAGRLIPGKAQHDEATMQNGWKGGEQILIGKQSWKNDGYGWVGPWGSVWSHDRVLPKTDVKIVDGACTVTDGQGSPWKEYDLKIVPESTIDPGPLAVSIRVDVGSGLIVRYEKLASPTRGVSVVATYRHDATIRIDPPVVDPERRKANALAAFNKEVERADQSCRDTVVKILQAGRDGMPFKYKIEGDLWSGVWGMHGTVVPPHSLHNVVEGVERHGGGSEYIVIGPDAWSKAPFHDWKKTANPTPLAGAVSASWSGALFFDDFLIGTESHVGRAQCPRPGGEAGAAADYYEYDLYRDTAGGRFRVATQRLYTDGTRPVKLETIGHQGRLMQVQTRTYIPDLVITQPPVAPK